MSLAGGSRLIKGCIANRVVFVFVVLEGLTKASRYQSLAERFAPVRQSAASRLPYPAPSV